MYSTSNFSPIFLLSVVGCGTYVCYRQVTEVQPSTVNTLYTCFFFSNVHHTLYVYTLLYNYYTQLPSATLSCTLHTVVVPCSGKLVLLDAIDYVGFRSDYVQSSAVDISSIVPEEKGRGDEKEE